MDDLAGLIRWVRGANPPPAVARALVAALLELAELRRRAPRSHLALLSDVAALARAVARCGGDHHRARAAFRHWSHSQWYRRLAMFRAQQNRSAGGSAASLNGARHMPPRKTVPIQNATDPVTHPTFGKPAVPEELKTAPRADGGAATGTTGGNHVQPAEVTGAGMPQHGITLGEPSK